MFTAVENNSSHISNGPHVLNQYATPVKFTH